MSIEFLKGLNEWKKKTEREIENCKEMFHNYGFSDEEKKVINDKELKLCNVLESIEESIERTEKKINSCNVEQEKVLKCLL